MTEREIRRCNGCGSSTFKLVRTNKGNLIRVECANCENTISDLEVIHHAEEQKDQ